MGYLIVTESYHQLNAIFTLDKDLMRPVDGHNDQSILVQADLNVFEHPNFEEDYKDRYGGSVGLNSCCNNSGGVAGCDDVSRRKDLDMFWTNNRNHEKIPETAQDELCATVDRGCQRMAIGLETLRKLNAALPRGLQTHLVPQEYCFRSVHGTSTTKSVAVIPNQSWSSGESPAIFESKESCHAPFLISLPFLMRCKAIIYLRDCGFISRNLGLPWGVILDRLGR